MTLGASVAAGVGISATACSIAAPLIANAVVDDELTSDISKVIKKINPSQQADESALQVLLAAIEEFQITSQETVAKIQLDFDVKLGDAEAMLPTLMSSSDWVETTSDWVKGTTLTGKAGYSSIKVVQFTQYTRWVSSIDQMAFLNEHQMGLLQGNAKFNEAGLKGVSVFAAIAVVLDIVFLTLDSIELADLVDEADRAASMSKSWEDLNSASQFLRKSRTDVLTAYTRLLDSVEIMTGGGVWVRTMNMHALDTGTPAPSSPHRVTAKWSSGDCCGPGEPDDDLYAQILRVPGLESEARGDLSPRCRAPGTALCSEACTGSNGFCKAGQVCLWGFWTNSCWDVPKPEDPTPSEGDMDVLTLYMPSLDAPDSEKDTMSRATFNNYSRSELQKLTTPVVKPLSLTFASTFRVASDFTVTSAVNGLLLGFDDTGKVQMSTRPASGEIPESCKWQTEVLKSGGSLLSFDMQKGLSIGEKNEESVAHLQMVDADLSNVWQAIDEGSGFIESVVTYQVISAKGILKNLDDVNRNVNGAKPTAEGIVSDNRGSTSSELNYETFNSFEHQKWKFVPCDAMPFYLTVDAFKKVCQQTLGCDGAADTSCRWGAIVLDSVPDNYLWANDAEVVTTYYKLKGLDGGVEVADKSYYLSAFWKRTSLGNGRYLIQSHPGGKGRGGYLTTTPGSHLGLYSRCEEEGDGKKFIDGESTYSFPTSWSGGDCCDGGFRLDTHLGGGSNTFDTIIDYCTRLQENEKDKTATLDGDRTTPQSEWFEKDPGCYYVVGYEGSDYSYSDLKLCNQCEEPPSFLEKWPTEGALAKEGCSSQDISESEGGSSCSYGGYCQYGFWWNNCINHVHGYGVSPWIYFNGCHPDEQVWKFA
jgi:hypothetical protein